MLGVLLSIAAFHVAVLGRFEYFEDAVRVQGWGAVFFSMGAAVSALIVVPIAVFHIRDMAQLPAKPITWLFMGFGFGIVTPILTGGLTRTAGAFAGLAEGVYGVSSLPSLLIDAVIVFPYDMFVQGAPNVYAGLLSGRVFRDHRVRSRPYEHGEDRSGLDVGDLDTRIWPRPTDNGVRLSRADRVSTRYRPIATTTVVRYWT